MPFTTSPQSNSLSQALGTKVLGLPRGTSKGDTWEMMVCNVDAFGGEWMRRRMRMRMRMRMRINCSMNIVHCTFYFEH